MPQRLLSIEEAGRRLKVSRATLYRMIQRGKILSVRERGHRRIPESELAHRRVCKRMQDLPPFTPDNPIFELAGAYRSDGKGPGSSDKYAVLYGRRAD